MKANNYAASWLAAWALCLVLAGCAGIEGVPYQSGTPAAKIHEERNGQLAGRDTRNERRSTATPSIIPVVALEPEVACCLDFSSVQVDVNEDGGKRFVTAYSVVSPQVLVWRIGLIKDGKEYYHFTAATKHHFLSEAIPLEPLALDPTLPVPDKIVVARVKPASP